MKDKEKPWEKLKISRGAWFRARAEGRDPATVKGRNRVPQVRRFYRTLKTASEAAQRLGIRTKTEYRERIPEDLKLKSNPDTHYSNWTNWGDFLGTGRNRRKAENCYATWQQAAKAALRLGCTRTSTSTEYREIWRQDPKLPSHPDEMYEAKGWPGWDKFFLVNG